ncbi:MAG: hypothetical protein NWS46_05400 [Cyclobacteriaceae bacterium]|jgi:hypothetical protein|nr:hypothetical protein [Cyclobacteriaceae bacterium]
MVETSYIPRKAKVYLDKSYVKVYWDPTTKILYTIWKGFSTFDEISAIGHRILDAVVFEKAAKVLYDAREIEILDNDSEKYISGIFTKEMIGAGVKYAAAVLPEDIFAKYSIDNIQKKMIDNKNALVNYFKSMTNAIQWLENK